MPNDWRKSGCPCHIHSLDETKQHPELCDPGFYEYSSILFGSDSIGLESLGAHFGPWSSRQGGLVELMKAHSSVPVISFSPDSWSGSIDTATGEKESHNLHHLQVFVLEG